MKIKDIVSEDGVTIAGISGDKAKLSNGQEVDAKTLTPDDKHPGQFTMPQIDPTAIKPGAVVNTGDGDSEMGEAQDDEEEHPGHVHYNDWMNSEHAPQDDDSGDENKVFHKALAFLHSKGVHPGDIEFHAHHMAHKFHGGIEEGHHDLISQGNHPVGGDATDSFINQVRDKRWERGARGGDAAVKSPISGKLAESDELMKWLTIAGIK